MKRYGNLWDSMLSWENLVLAARKARRGKRERPVVQSFEFNLEANLLALKEELTSGSYTPGPFVTHWVTRPKPRLISAAPYRDRVVHHALMNPLEPILDRHFHDHSYACRKGKGTHAAADRLQRLMRRHQYLVKCDIRKFFPSIDHEILKTEFRRRIKDRQLLWLMNIIVDHSNLQEPVCDWFAGDSLFTPVERRKGLPIGNLTSQWFANWMLDGLDHLVTSHCRVGAYVRYCDDFVLLGDDRHVLSDALHAARKWLHSRRLRLHEERIEIRRTAYPVRFVGFRIGREGRKLPRENVRAFKRRLIWMREAYAAGACNAEEIRFRLNSWIAHARHGNAGMLVKRLSRDWKFLRAGAEDASRVARR